MQSTLNIAQFTGIYFVQHFTTFSLTVNDTYGKILIEGETYKKLRRT